MQEIAILGTFSLCNTAITGCFFFSKLKKVVDKFQFYIKLESMKEKTIERLKIDCGGEVKVINLRNPLNSVEGQDELSEKVKEAFSYSDWMDGFSILLPNEKISLTEKETALYQAIERGMNEPGCGWLHELAPETHETAGVLGSLVKKGLVTSMECKEPGLEVAYWVSISE